MIEQSISLIIAAALGALLGVERSLAGKQAGLRTYALVSLGSCLFAVLGVAASSMLAPAFSSLNPMQFFGSIILGIGFIGSGLSFAREGERHAELTTASGLWVAAGIGMACGFGFYALGAVSTVLAILVFTVFLKFENGVLRKNRSAPEQ